MCELGSKEKNHRRIVDPNDDHDQRSGSAVGRTDSSLWTPDLGELRRAELVDNFKVGAGEDRFSRVEFFA